MDLTDQQWTIIEALFEEKRQLSPLSHAANLRKEMATLMNQWIEENSAAMLARWLMEDRERESAEPSMAAPRPEGGQLSIGL